MSASRTREDEAAAARSYWAEQGRNPFYEQAQHWRRFIARQVARYAPSSVLEFGCNAGANLVEVRQILPEAALVGVDVNADAVRAGASRHELDLRVGGEEFLESTSDGAFDVVFTVSVLDHLPEVEPAFRELARVARRAIVLLEPFTGEVSRVDAGAEQSALSDVPFTYTWDYIGLGRRLGAQWRWTWTPYPLSSVNMGPHYWLIEGRRG